MLLDQILSCIKEKDMDALKALLANAAEIEILNAFPELDPKEQVIVFRLLAKDKALSIFEELDTDDQQNLMRSFTDAQANELVNELAPDDRVRLLDELPATVAKRIMASLSPNERAMTNLLMGYEAQTAGRIMTPEYVRLHKELTAAQALEKVKINAVEKETIYTIYITDHKRRLEGFLSLRDLLIAKPDAKIESIMEKITITVSTDTDQEEVARTLQRLDWLAIPVVDKEGLLVGIVTLDDAIDILEDEATEDMLTQAGLMAGKEANRSEALINGSILTIWKVRLPFLFIAIVGGTLAAVVMSGFEDVLDASVAVAFFIPLIMDLGGSVGTQSSTVFARGVALGHINMAHFAKHFAKEISVGLSLGAITGVISGLISGGISTVLHDGNVAVIGGEAWRIGLAVGLSVTVTATIASFLGFLVPYVLVKRNVDPAAGSSPIITTIKDISGLLVYFMFASIFLHHLLY